MGDRSPITTLKDKEFWHNQLAEQENVMLGFKVLREEGDTKHTMEGNPPFGMLTKKGVADMEVKGAKLRKEIMSLGGVVDSEFVNCVCTNFNRTLGSAQNFLKGLGVTLGDNVSIDTRCWRNMIPDAYYHEFHENLKHYETELREFSKGKFHDVHTLVASKLLRSGICGFETGPDASAPGGINLDRLCEILICLDSYGQLEKTEITRDEYKAILSVKEKWCFAFRKFQKLFKVVWLHFCTAS